MVAGLALQHHDLFVIRRHDALAVGDWQEIELPPAAVASAGAAAEPGPAPGLQESVIRGTIAARATLPEPHTVPYKDCLFAVHLEEVEVRSGGAVADRVIGYLWGMRDHVWTDAAGYWVGQQITLRVRPWEEREVQQRYGTYNRKELDDPELLLIPAYWGELQD